MTSKIDWQFNVIQTPRLIVEPINHKFSKEIFHEKQNPSVNRYLANKSASTMEELNKRIDSVMIRNANKETIQLQTSTIQENEFLGLCGIKEPNSGKPEIGFWFKQDAWGKGYGKELIGGLINRIKGNLEYEYIIYEVFENNVGSVKIIESYGGQKHSQEPKVNYFGETMNHLQYRIYD